MRSLLLVLGSCAIFAASADEPASAPSPQTAVAAAPASLNAPAATTAPASATASGGWVIRMVAPSTASKPGPQAAATVAAPVASAVVTAPSCEDIKTFKTKMHAAVDAALKYPAAMKFEPVAGVTIVTYDYEDGRTLDPHITQWSGDGRLDRAALNAVKAADFASISPGIGHTHIHDAVIIVFDNSANIDKNAAEHEKKKDLAAEKCGS